MAERQSARMSKITKTKTIHNPCSMCLIIGYLFWDSGAYKSLTYLLTAISLLTHVLFAAVAISKQHSVTSDVLL